MGAKLAVVLNLAAVLMMLTERWTVIVSNCVLMEHAPTYLDLVFENLTDTPLATERVPRCQCECAIVRWPCTAPFFFLRLNKFRLCTLH